MSWILGAFGRVPEWWDRLVVEVWPDAWKAAAFLFVVGGGTVWASMWGLRIAGQWHIGSLRMLRRLPGGRPRLRVIAVSPHPDLEHVADGFPALVAAARSELGARGQASRLRFARPVHGFESVVAPMLQGPNEVGWIGAVMILMHWVLPAEDFTLRATFHDGRKQGVSFELFRGGSMRTAVALWHIGDPLGNGTEPTRHLEDLAHLFDAPAAAWVQSMLDTCTRAARDDRPCEAVARSKAMVELGIRYHQLSDLVRARRCYETARVLAPDNLAARFNLAMVDLREHDYSAAIAVLEEIVADADPERDWVWYYAKYNLGTAYLHRHLAPSRGHASHADDLQHAYDARKELVERGDAFLHDQGWEMTGEYPARRLRRGQGPLRWRGKRRHPHRMIIERALRRDGGIGIAAAATATVLHKRDFKEAERYAARARSAARGPNRAINASVLYNLACYEAACRRPADAVALLEESIGLISHGSASDQLAWAAKDPVLEPATNSAAFATLRAKYGDSGAQTDGASRRSYESRRLLMSLWRRATVWILWRA